MSSTFVTEWAKAQQPKGPSMKNAPVFYRNLEEELDIKRAQHSCAMLHTKDHVVDFSSCDTLSLGLSGSSRMAFLDELAENPNFHPSSHGSRLTDGNTKYLETLEKELAEFHGADSALIVHTGSLGNGAIFSAVPLPGDAIIYDELVHASIHDGMKNSLVLYKRSFRHNDPDSLSDALIAVRDSQPQIRNGSHTVLISVESIYSMEGDVCPLRELIEVTKEIFPNGNAQFIVDEAHSGGVIGPSGRGLVSALGLEKEVAIRLHTMGKAWCASGGLILSNMTVRTMLLNHSKTVLFSDAPPFPILASIRATYKLMSSGQTQQAQEKIQNVVKLFLEKVTSIPVWDQAESIGLLRIPLYAEGWESLPFVTQIVPIWTRPGHSFYLAIHLQMFGFSAYPMVFPVVPKGTERVRLMFHAANTTEEVEALVSSIGVWAEEMMEIEKGGDGVRLPTAARQAFALMTKEGLSKLA